MTLNNQLLAGEWVNTCKMIFSKKTLQYIKIGNNTQPANTCSKLTIETLEQDVKNVQS